MINKTFVELVICLKRFKSLSTASPFFWSSKRDGRVWIKSNSKTSAFCIDTGEIRYIAPNARVEEIIGGF